MVDRLVSENHSVRIIDNLEHQVHNGRMPEYANPSAEYVKGDVRNEDDLKKALEDIEIVFHQAALVGVGQSM